MDSFIHSNDYYELYMKRNHMIKEFLKGNITLLFWRMEDYDDARIKAYQYARNALNLNVGCVLYDMNPDAKKHGFPLFVWRKHLGCNNYETLWAFSVMDSIVLDENVPDSAPKDVFDYYKSVLYKSALYAYKHEEKEKKEEKTMDYNKKKDTSIDVMRDVTREEVVTVSSIRDLAAGDKIKVMINGEVYEAKVARRPPIDYSGETELAIAVNIDKPLSKTWKDLGYDCFEDMIDDIAKRHGSLGTRYKCCGCFDAVDSYGESYVEIEQNGAKTIVHSDNVTVYPVRKEDD